MLNQSKDMFYDEDIGEESNIDVNELDGNHYMMRENMDLFRGGAPSSRGVISPNKSMNSLVPSVLWDHTKSAKSVQ